MKRKIIPILILYIVIGCKKDIKYEVPSGDLVGFVKLKNPNFEMYSDHSGVEVNVEGSSPNIRVYSEESGIFIIEDLKAGTYNVIFSKEGFGTYKIVGYQFVGGNEPATLYETSLYEVPQIEIDSLNLYDVEYWFSSVIGVTANYTYLDDEIPMFPYFIYYLSSSSDVSYTNYETTGTMYGYNMQIRESYEVDTFHYPIGTDMYMIVYPITHPSQKYLDIQTGLDIYSTINIDQGSNVASIKVPEWGTYQWKRE